MSKADPLRLYVGDDFNPEKRAGQPRNVGGVRYLLTWFTSGSGWRWADDDLLARMKVAKEIRGNTKWVLVEYHKNVYYRDGVFYVSATHKNAEKRGDFAELVPAEGSIWTCRPKYQQRYGLPDAEILCMGGVPTSIRIGGDAFMVTNDSWPAMEAFLGLDEMYKPERFRPTHTNAA